MYCVHDILMETTEGQHVVLDMLEVFVNRWRRFLANVTSLCAEERERERERREHLISNGTKERESIRKEFFIITVKKNALEQEETLFIPRFCP